MDLLERIHSLSHQIHPEIINMRRHIHAHPELSYEEFNTAKFIVSKLNSS